MRGGLRHGPAAVRRRLQPRRQNPSPWEGCERSCSRDLLAGKLAKRIGAGQLDHTVAVVFAKDGRSLAVAEDMHGKYEQSKLLSTKRASPSRICKGPNRRSVAWP